MTKRLRRWVALSDDEDSLPYHLDEQEQENVITTLRKQNTESNDLFKVPSALASANPQKAFAILSLIPTIVFIVIPSHLSLLGITSLALTAYTAYFLPLKQSIVPRNPDDGPLRFVPILNGALASIVLLASFVRTNTQGLWIGAIPSIMWTVIWIGRTWANSIDLDGLETLKYNVTPTQLKKSDSSIKVHS